MYRFDPQQIEHRRVALGFRRERVAVALDRSAETVKLWESGRVTPNAGQLARLADLLGCDVADFFEVAS